jgi:hypothetical protein
MSPRSERSSASFASKPPARISAARDGPLDLGLLELGLGVHDLLLHLLRLLEQGVHVETALTEGVLGHRGASRPGRCDISRA